MVAVYDVVEIAGISYGMISKTLAYDLNRNIQKSYHVMPQSRYLAPREMSRSRYLAAARRDVTEAEKRNHADFYDFCPMIFTFSDHCLFVILGASHAHNTRQPVIHSEQRADER